MSPAETRRPRIAITGANGFVGSHLTAFLSDRDMDVTAIVRTRSNLAPVRPGVRVYHVHDLSDSADVRSALTGHDVLVHLVARTHAGSRSTRDAWPDYLWTNVGLTSAVTRMACDVGVRRVVYLSSIKAVAERSSERVAEEHTPEPEDAYGHTKAMAERVVEDACAIAGIQHAILRPPLIYGPGVKGNLDTLVHAARRGIPLPLGRATNERSLVSIHNLCSAIHVLVRMPQPLHHTFHVADPEPITVANLYSLLLREFGRAAILPRVPVPWLRTAARLFGRSAVADRLFGRLVLDTTRIQQVLDWSPPQTSQEGLRHMVAAYRDEA